jgi:hypothetical protein
MSLGMRQSNAREKRDPFQKYLRPGDENTRPLLNGGRIFDTSKAQAIRFE